VEDGIGRTDVVPVTPALMIVGLLHGSTKEAPATAGADRMTLSRRSSSGSHREHGDLLPAALSWRRVGN